MMPDQPTTAIILAGGFATRLQPRVADRPKALAPTGPVPFLALQLEWLERQGIQSAGLAVYHLADQIEDFAARGYRGGLTLTCLRDPRGPLGTGGAIKNAFKALDLAGDAVVLNGDTFFSFDLDSLIATHQREGTGATLAVASVADADRYGAVELRGDRVASFHEKGAGGGSFVNCGAYLLAASVVASMPDGAFSVERDFFPTLAQKGTLAVHIIAGGFVDIGTPESYDSFVHDVTQRQT